MGAFQAEGLMWIRLEPDDSHPLWLGGVRRITPEDMGPFTSETKNFPSLFTREAPQGSQYDFLCLPTTDTAVSSGRSNVRRPCAEHVLTERTTALLEELDRRLDAVNIQSSLSSVIWH